MKKLFVAGIAAAALLCGAPAIAADIPVKAPAYKAVAPAFNWTGCYAGIEGGGAWGRSVQTFQDAVPALIGLTLVDLHPNGVILGGTVGCNYQTSNWVWGVENDLSWTNLKKNPTSLLPPFNPAVLMGVKTSWLDTLRGRLGYAVDKSLWYVTGGLAFTDIKATEAGVVSESHTKTRTGWTVGAGVEWALADSRWSVKVEYLYVDFNKKFYDFALDADRDVNLREHIARVGLNYKFGDVGKGPVYAKY
jgi:outer membrane immunogenic protein